MNRDQLADWLHCLQGGMYDWVIDEIKKEIAKPEQDHGFDRTASHMAGEYVDTAQPKQEPVPFPSFMRKRIEQAMNDAINPQGMSVHDGKAKVLASDLHRMLLVIDSVPRKEWVGLTSNEVWDVYEEDNYDALRFARAIEAKLKEKNDAV